MSQVLIDPSSLTAIGEAIRSKNKQTVKYKPNEMAGAIKALALDNSVTIQSNDAWKYVIDPTLEHQSITVKVSGKLTGDNTTGYKGEVIFDPYITSNFGWLAGKITKTVDNTNHVVTFSAAATEISGMLQDGWTPVYVVDGKYYTTTTPDNTNSLKSVSSSDNIENLLICGYYTLDKSTNKLVATEPTTDIGPVSNSVTKNYQNKYIKEINYYHSFRNCYSLITVDISNATSIGSYAFENCDALTTVDISNATSISSDAFNSNNSAITYIILNNNTPPDFGASSNDVNGLCFLIPQTAFDSYISKWASISNILDHIDYIKSYDITRVNCTITVKPLVTTLNFSINKTNTKKVDVAANTGVSYEFSTFDDRRDNVFFYNANYMYIVSYYKAFGAKLIKKAVSLKITRASDNSGGTFTIKEPSKDKYSFGDGCGARFNLSTYVEGNPGCSINDLKTAFENGETLNFEMKIQ